MITEETLMRYWNPPSQTEMAKIKSTKDQIQDFLKRNLNIDEIKKNYSLSTFNYDVYLQGSYSNSTNVTFSSDVDIVIEFTWEYYYDIKSLSSSDMEIFKNNLSGGGSDYDMVKFKNDIYDLFNYSRWQPEYKSKCIKLPWNTNRCDADIVPCFTFKKFNTITQSKSGIKFKNTTTQEEIINFPKIHKENMSLKNDITNTKFKKIVRTFKSLRRDMIEKKIINKDLAPWYLIENLIYNVPNNIFDNYSYKDIFEQTINYCGKLENFMFSRCANWIDEMFWGTMWKEEDLLIFISELKKYYLNN